MRHIYFFLYSFLAKTPNREKAYKWAAIVTPLFFVMNALVAWGGLQVIRAKYIPIGNGKIVFGMIIALSCGYSYWKFYLQGSGRAIVEELMKRHRSGRSALWGALIFFETMFGWLIPWLVAILRK